MPFSLQWLPAVLHQAGLKVAEVPGWQNRGRGEIGQIVGVICHHTADTRSGNMPSLDTLIRGRRDLAGPLAQLGLGRDGTYYVIAAGRCNHAGEGAWLGFTAGNRNFIGIEAENRGRQDDAWPDVQLDAYRRGVAAILRHVGRGPEFCVAHREWTEARADPATRKPDPRFDMDLFRGVVATLMGDGLPAPLIPREEPAGERRPTLRRGDEHPLVRDVQRRLGIEAQTSHFGPKTEALLREFQRKHGLVADGILGPETWKVLAPA